MRKFDAERKKRRRALREAQAEQQQKKRVLLAVAIPLAVIVALILAMVIYVNIYYRADTAAIEAFVPENPVLQKNLENGAIAFEPVETPMAGLIFYPGGKVETAAYIPLMEAMAARGILCILVDMPFRLAVLDSDAAYGMQELYPAVETWYLGGHSLGGAMAAEYLAKTEEEFDGLLLLGAYASTDLSDTDLAVLSVYGSEDGVMDREKYDACRENLPDGAEEFVIEGGNHAYFGTYGAQRGDGEASITNAEQVCKTAELFFVHLLLQAPAE